jgi:hypothetical protein
VSSLARKEDDAARIARKNRAVNPAMYTSTRCMASGEKGAGLAGPGYPLSGLMAPRTRRSSLASAW